MNFLKNFLKNILFKYIVKRLEIDDYNSYGKWYDPKNDSTRNVKKFILGDAVVNPIKKRHIRLVILFFWRLFGSLSYFYVVIYKWIFLSNFSWYCFDFKNYENVFFFFYFLEWNVLMFSILFFLFLGLQGFFAINAISAFLSLISFLFYFKDFELNNKQAVATFIEIINLHDFNINISFYVDFLSFNFSFLTAIIGFCSYVYGISYMRFEKQALLFLGYLQAFKLSMILLVWASNWMTLILGWELIGITSFLLINFWTSKIGTLKSAFKAFSFNKISDACLIIVMCFFLSFGTVEIQNSIDIALTAGFNNFYFFSWLSLKDLIVFFLIIASFCKSAQFGFHFWLPDSMEAPVPASALIHSATLVSAGIYLLLRFNFLLISSNLIDAFKLATSFTAFFGATVASIQTDLKKILAYSTISHCGILMYSICFYNPQITVFYLFVHGFFKSLCFLCVGNFIQHANNYQDISKTGAFNIYYSFEKFFILICAFNLSSAPLFISFFSKHWIIENLNNCNYTDLISIVFLFLTAFFGFFYSSKISYNVLFGSKKSHWKTYNIRVYDLEFKSDYHFYQRGYWGQFERWEYLQKTNYLSIVAMSALFLMTFFVLFFLIDCFSITNFVDFNSFEIKHHSSFNLFLNVWFSWILVVCFYCYLRYKNTNSSVLFVLLSLVIFQFFFLIL